MMWWMALSVAVLLTGCGAGGKVVDPPRIASPDAATVVFGDGMVDAGQVSGKRYTVNDTRVQPTFRTWVEYFEQNFGRTMLPSSAGGKNYARGGARIAGAAGSNSLAEQVASYSAGFGKDDVAVIAIGVEDVRQQVEAVKAGTLTEAQAATNLREAAAEYVGSVEVLIGKGAKTLLLTTTHDLGQTQWAKNLGVQALAGRFSRLLESQVAILAHERYSGTAQQARILLVRVTDVGSLVFGRNAGFDRGADPLCKGAAATDVLLCTDRTLVTDKESEQGKYTYADHLYLSPSSHLALAKYIRNYMNSRWGS